jgi:hypothetical protein
MLTEPFILILGLPAWASAACLSGLASWKRAVPRR